MREGTEAQRKSAKRENLRWGEVGFRDMGSVAQEAGVNTVKILKS